MPKVKLGKPDFEKLFGLTMKSAVTRSGQLTKDVAKKVGYDAGTLSKHYSNPGTMTLKKFKLFIKAAGLTEEEVLDYLYERQEKGA